MVVQPALPERRDSAVQFVGAVEEWLPAGDTRGSGLARTAGVNSDSGGSGSITQRLKEEGEKVTHRRICDTLASTAESSQRGHIQPCF